MKERWLCKYDIGRYGFLGVTRETGRSLEGRSILYLPVDSLNNLIFVH
jgi:hypothetical protein